MSKIQMSVNSAHAACSNSATITRKSKTIELKLKGVTPLEISELVLINLDGIFYYPVGAMERNIQLGCNRTYRKKVRETVTVVGVTKKIKPMCLSDKRKTIDSNLLPIAVKGGVGDVDITITSSLSSMKCHYKQLIDWEMPIKVRFLPDVIKEEKLRLIIANAGRKIGLGHNRPHQLGVYGQFEVK